MSAPSEKRQTQIAFHTLLNGFKSSVEVFSITESEATTHLNSLISHPVPLFSTIRNEILSSIQTKGPKAITDIWGISDKTISLLSSNFPAPSTKEFKDTPSSASPSDLKSFQSVLVSTQDSDNTKKKGKNSEDKRKLTNYTIDQKIEAVKEFLKRSNQSEIARELHIPAVNLIRWRDKLKKDAFQEVHAENLSDVGKKGQRNKMLKELDSKILKLYNDGVEKTDQKLLEYAKELAKIDESEPQVSRVWLEAFKKHFKLL